MARNTRMGDMKKCELQGCKSKGKSKDSVGRFQVYDPGPPKLATMNRPAHLCQGCVNFSKTCGMEPEKA